MRENNTPVKTETVEAPVFRKKIRDTTYVVKVHFSETAKETLEAKIKRMLRNEVEQNVNNF
jgi:hypothetical protein